MTEETLVPTVPPVPTEGDQDYVIERTEVITSNSLTAIRAGIDRLIERGQPEGSSLTMELTFYHPGVKLVARFSMDDGSVRSAQDRMRMRAAVAPWRADEAS